MTLSINADCSVITLVSEEGLIADILSPESTDCCTTLEIGTNCCTPTTTFELPMIYTFGYNITDCAVNDDLDPDGYTITLEITGINADCVTSLSYPSTNSAGITTETNPTDLSFTYAFNQFNPLTGLDFEVVITTCDALEYTLNFNIEVGLDVCATLNPGAVTTTFPAGPTGVTIINATTMEIIPELFGYTTGVFPDGIYYFALTQNNTTGNISESDTIFVDCDTTCRVIDVLANDLCSEIYLFLDALKYSFDCDTITYQQQCDLWFVIAKQLGYFVNTPCGEPQTSCGTCNK